MGVHAQKLTEKKWFRRVAFPQVGFIFGASSFSAAIATAPEQSGLSLG
jgi:hypothetical protein